MARRPRSYTSVPSGAAPAPARDPSDMTFTEVDKHIEEVVLERAPCRVEFTTYRGFNTNAERAVHLLWNPGGRHVVTLKEAYRDKPARIDIITVESTLEATLKKAKGSAFFSLTKSGFERAAIKTINGEARNAHDLWEGCFKGYKSNNAAKAQFLRMIGAQDRDSMFAREAAKAEKVAAVRRAAEQALAEAEKGNRYASTAGYGMF